MRLQQQQQLEHQVVMTITTTSRSCYGARLWCVGGPSESCQQHKQTLSRALPGEDSKGFAHDMSIAFNFSMFIKIIKNRNYIHFLASKESLGILQGCTQRKPRLKWSVAACVSSQLNSERAQVWRGANGMAIAWCKATADSWAILRTNVPQGYH